MRSESDFSRQITSSNDPQEIRIRVKFITLGLIENSMDEEIIALVLEEKQRMLKNWVNP